MDDTMLLQLLNEIDSMTSEEYWKFFNESQKLPYCSMTSEEYWESFDKLRKHPDSNWELLPSKLGRELTPVPSCISFSVNYEWHSGISGNSCYSEAGSTSWLQAA